MNDDDLIAKLREVSFATLGHFLECGFVSHEVRAMVPGGCIVGHAVTLRLAEPDAIAVNRALVSLKPGDVLVIDTVGEHAHACVGAVTQLAARCASAAGIIVDGLVTDINELRTCQLPVFARGTTQLTTKLIDSTKCQLNVSVNCAGVEVHPGDIVLADDNGVLIIPAAELAAVIDKALQSDLAEPGLLARLRNGEPLEKVLATGNNS